MLRLNFSDRVCSIGWGYTFSFVAAELRLRDIGICAAGGKLGKVTEAMASNHLLINPGRQNHMTTTKALPLLARIDSLRNVRDLTG